MIDLGRHIEILLLSNDCVIVPNLGGFMAHHVDACVDKSDYTFLPPLRAVGFNPKLTLNDSLLAQSYVEAYDISYPEAVMRIEDEVRELKQVLERDGMFELSDIGQLSLNDDGHIVFEPCQAGILTPRLYGLSRFEMKPLAELAKEEQAARMKVEVQQLKPANVTVAEEQPTQASSILDDVEEGTVRVRISWIRNFAVACLALLAFFFFPSQLSHDHLSPIKGSVDTGLLLKVLPSNVTKGEAEVKAMAKTAVKKEKGLTAEEADKNATVDEPYYTLVLACRISKRNAANYAEHLQHQGHSEVHVLNDRKGVKVAYGKYATKEEALSRLNKLNDDKEFSDAWIMKYTPEK
jgi:hypothetical protein